MRRLLLLLLLVTILVAGCGSSKESEPTVTVTPAATQAEWVDRLVNRFLRPINKDLEVVNSLGTPQAKVFIQTGNETTLRILRTRMRDLAGCSRKLDRVGPPPDSQTPLPAIYADFRKACTQYERLADSVLTAVPLLSSGDPAKIPDGEKEFAKASEPSRLGAQAFGSALDLLDRNHLLDKYQSG